MPTERTHLLPKTRSSFLSHNVTRTLPFALLVLVIYSVAFYLLWTYDPYAKRPLPPLTGRFIHITDIHPDPYYITNGTAKSSCHNAGEENIDDGFRTTKKPKYMRMGRGGVWGAPATVCDSSMKMVNYTFEWLKENWRDKVDFVIWTGDNSRHDKDIPRSKEEVFNLNRMVAQKFIDAFSDPETGQLSVPVIPSIGNNDMHPSNRIGPGPNEILDTLADIWSPFIPPTQQHVFRRGGYFVKEVIPDRLIVISLNTLAFYKANKASDGCSNTNDAGSRQLRWMEEILRRARTRDMKAYIIGHVAPRRKQYMSSCFKKYGRIALKFHDMILGHHFGHSNLDHFFFISAKAVVDSPSDDTTELGVADEDDKVDSVENNNSDSHINGTSNPLNATRDDKRVYAYAYEEYAEKLLEHYRSVPPLQMLNPEEYTVIHINPSIIPTFFPSLRVFHYNKTENWMNAAEISRDTADEFYTELDEDDISDDKDDDMHSTRGKRSKHRHDPKSPSHTNTFLTALGYTQYFVNLTKANEYPNTKPSWDVEYTTQETYGMRDLTIDSWIKLARKIAKDGMSGFLWKKVQGHMLVGTTEIIKERERMGLQRLNGGKGDKGPMDYIMSELEF
ncbi:10416_t:CDS:2 [Paraglomus occultum]|uniref:Endopolyphosphatase n=1 Tax=Paraglomus occultum TaxID=144539 RepID=A0A9N8VMU5_9GLOM|nr:10416_t:CDS:2 [Paraglomus occultum]